MDVGEFTRRKREKCMRSPNCKHNSIFSKWKILIGPDDWENNSSDDEDGIERYMIHNLPNYSCPALYELGIATSHKLDTRNVIGVYLGQTGNLRNRLQLYGQGGSHLNYGLFSEIFLRGFPIVFRWTPMKHKMEAEEIEDWFLSNFDYAWNKVGNGARRPNEILRKLDKISSRSYGIDETDTAICGMPGCVCRMRPVVCSRCGRIFKYI